MRIYLSFTVFLAFYSSQPALCGEDSGTGPIDICTEEFIDETFYLVYTKSSPTPVYCIVNKNTPADQKPCYRCQGLSANVCNPEKARRVLQPCEKYGGLGPEE